VTGFRTLFQSRVENIMRLRFTVCLAAVVVFLSTLQADNWPQWRGPSGDGISKETGVPSKWSKEENILWSVPLPGMGGSTPVIWGDRLFLTTENKDKTLSLLCFNTKERRTTGTGRRGQRRVGFALY
jgi:hypothetical protein